MMFDRVAILDWSAAKGPRLGKDSIWLAEACGPSQTARTLTARNLPTRLAAEAALCDLVHTSLGRGHRLLIGADFAFGTPSGFCAHLTGTPQALNLWAWLAARVTDTEANVTNYRHVAAQMNRHFPGDGPFWGNGEKQQIPGLPRLKPALPPGLALHRATDLAARGPGAAPKPVWQLAGAGAVGAQVLTGLPMLHRLRTRFASQIAVWPFQPATAPVVLAEVYPSLLAAEVRHLTATTGMVTDQAQVRLLAQSLAGLPAAALGRIMAVSAPALSEEGWILGAGHTGLLRQALG
ncbi:MAG: molybdopterin guanine dinucleotide synthesis [Rhodobacteraceae bacterium]|nr:molybdopterin guanine dinucleotide synthesis [Paracoccaceae bacterium]